MITIPTIERSSLSINRLLVWGVFFLCAYAAWACGGVRPALQWPLFLSAALLCIAGFLLPVEQRRRIASRVSRDPIFYSGGIFLLLLFVQWINSGYGIAMDGLSVSSLGRAPSKWVPWSIDRAAAAEMLNWFFPAFSALLIVRNILHRTDIKVLVHLMVWNAAALACAGILQYMLGSGRILGIWNAPRSDFFATFDYPNHAAAWFYLYAALSAGLAHDAEIKHKPRIRIAVLGACFLCCIAASCLTLSRVGAFVSLTLLLVVLFILLLRTRTCLSGAKAFNAYLAMTIVALVGATLFFGAGGGGLAHEMAGKALLGERSISNDLAGRAGNIVRAWAMAKDYLLFGTGGWGCHGLADLYVPAEELRLWMVNGKANVHCDPVQFLAEFGIIGSLCLGAVVAVLVRDMVVARHNVLFYWVAGGLLAVLVHSLIDLPFRCPAILLAWCCLFAALPRLAHKRTIG